VKREREKDDVEQSCQSENRSRSRIFDDSDSRTSSGEGRHRRREVVTEAKSGAAARGGGSAASSSSELLQVVLAAVRCRVCRIGFTTLPSVPLEEQYRCDSFIVGAQIVRGVGYHGIRWI
jgi:hypothetical protein